jgi:CheY-like chemotaxis protein
VAPVAQAAGDVVLVAMPAGELAQRTGELLAQRGLRVLFACDGVEAMLEIQRKLPRAIVLAAELPKMYGFQICEVVKRNESLRGIWVVLVGAIHHRERYRREPGELYGADAYVEGPELPAGLLPLLAKGGVPLGEAAAPPPSAPRTPLPPSAPRPPPAAPARMAAPLAPPPQPAAAPPAEPARVAPVEPARVARAAPVRGAPAAPVRGAPPARRGDGLDEERAKAERLARIVVSDIVLYNEQRFAAAARSGNVLDAMAGDLAEGRQLFEERIDARVRAERDHLKEELLRRAQGQGTR